MDKVGSSRRMSIGGLNSLPMPETRRTSTTDSGSGSLGRRMSLAQVGSTGTDSRRTSLAPGMSGAEGRRLSLAPAGTESRRMSISGGERRMSIVNGVPQAPIYMSPEDLEDEAKAKRRQSMHSGGNSAGLHGASGNMGSTEDNSHIDTNIPLQKQVGILLKEKNTLSSEKNDLTNKLTKVNKDYEKIKVQFHAVSKELENYKERYEEVNDLHYRDLRTIKRLKLYIEELEHEAQNLKMRNRRLKNELDEDLENEVVKEAVRKRDLRLQERRKSREAAEKELMAEEESDKKNLEDPTAREALVAAAAADLVKEGEGDTEATEE